MDGAAAWEAGTLAVPEGAAAGPPTMAGVAAGGCVAGGGVGEFEGGALDAGGLAAIPTKWKHN